MNLFAGIRQPGRFVWRGLVQPCLGWLLFGGLAALVPKKPGRFVVIGLAGQFTDNAKYLFLHLATRRRRGIEVRFLTGDDALVATLRARQLPVLRYPSFRGLWYLLRCQVVVADASSWTRPLRYQVLWRARKVQLWHGCPLKRIERDDRHVAGPGVSPLLTLSHRLIGRFPRHDLVLSPSARFTDVAFRRAIDSERIVEDDYPRNAALRLDDPRFLIGTDEAAAAWLRAGRRAGLRTVCYMPTFRDTGGDAVSDGALDLARLDRFAVARGAQFIVKLHDCAVSRLSLTGFSRIVGHGRADIYPLLRHCDVLVTDYSSVFFDFLHTQRPIAFFPYDLEKYQRDDRSLYFQYESVVPGPVCRDQDALERALEMFLDGPSPDPFARQRAETLTWSFARTDGDPAPRIADRIERELCRGR